jgi:thiamine biosynthesis lipoprotein
MIGLALASPGAAKPEEQRYSRAWLLMGTIFEVTLYAPDSAAAVSAFDAAYAAASEVDSLMSLYRPESELCRVNREAARGPVSVSGPTFEVVAASLKFSRETQGAFDPTVKPAMDAWGFYRRALHAPAPAELDSLRGLIGAEKIRLRPADRSIEFARAGMSLDLGGIAKGYAADRSAAALKRRGVTRALVDLGGNMLAMSSPPDEKGWPVGVRDPVRTDSLLAVIELADRAIASSGDYEKFVVLDGVRYGHLLDPKVAAPVRGMAGTTVVAGDAMTADALSTAAFVLGEAMCGEVLAGRPGVDYVCVSIDETLSLARYAGSGLFKNFLPTGTVATGLDGP